MIALKKYYRIIALPLFEDNYSYIVQGTSKKSLVLVDPANPTVVMTYLNSYFPHHIISHVLYTHKHWDHAGGSQELYEQIKKTNPQVQVVIGEHDKPFVKGSNFSLGPNQDLIIGNSRVKTVHVPCHTKGHTIYSFLPQLEDMGLIDNVQLGETTLQGKKIKSFDSHSCTFTGDSLFIGGIGRFFQGNAAEMTVNIQNMLKTIDWESDIFCGHEYALANLKWATAVEKQNNAMKEYYAELQRQQSQNGLIWSIPSSLKKQKEINIFVRTVTGTPLHEQIAKNPSELMRILRQMKNNNTTTYEKTNSSL